jgi:hypothetical protein
MKAANSFNHLYANIPFSLLVLAASAMYLQVRVGRLLLLGQPDLINGREAISLSKGRKMLKCLKQVSAIAVISGCLESLWPI